MNRLKFALFIVLTVVFGVLLILPDMRGDAPGRIGLRCGFVAQLLLAVVMYSEIRREKKGQDS